MMDVHYFTELDWLVDDWRYEISYPIEIKHSDYLQILGHKDRCSLWSSYMAYWHVVCTVPSWDWHRPQPDPRTHKRMPMCTFLAQSRPYVNDIPRFWKFNGPVCASGMDIIPVLVNAMRHADLLTELEKHTYLRR